MDWTGLMRPTQVTWEPGRWHSVFKYDQQSVIEQWPQQPMERTAFWHINRVRPLPLINSIDLYYMIQRVIHLPVLPLSSFPTAAPLPQAATTPPAGCSTCAPTRSSACTATITSSAASPRWLSRAPAVCCWLATTTSTATSGTPWRGTEQVGGREAALCCCHVQESETWSLRGDYIHDGGSSFRHWWSKIYDISVIFAYTLTTFCKSVFCNVGPKV